MMMTLIGQDAVHAALFLNRQPEIRAGSSWRSAKSEWDATSALRTSPSYVRLVIDERVFLEAIGNASIPVTDVLVDHVHRIDADPKRHVHMMQIFKRYFK